MSAAGRSAADVAAERLIATGDRLTRIWRHLSPDRRLAAGAAGGLFVTLFLPWYQETVIARGVTGLRSVSASLTGWAAFSWAEAAVLLVAVAVLALLVVRAEGRSVRLPGGDGGLITAAGGVAGLLIIWRMFDKQGTTARGQIETTSGIEWGIFVALAVAGLLAYAGSRIRRAPEPEPPVHGDPAAGGAPGPGGPSGGPDLEMDADVTWTVRPVDRSARSVGGGPVPGVECPAVSPTAVRAESPGAGGAETPSSSGAARGPESAGAVGRESQPLSPRPESQSLSPRPESQTTSGGPEPHRRVRPRSVAAGLDPAEINYLGIADPPTSPLRRARPAAERVGGSEAATERVGRADPDTERITGSEAATQRVGGPGPDTERITGSEAATERLGRPRPLSPAPTHEGDADEQLTLRLKRGE